MAQKGLKMAKKCPQIPKIYKQKFTLLKKHQKGFFKRKTQKFNQNQVKIR
jgi:hypothetical protein